MQIPTRCIVALLNMPLFSLPEQREAAVAAAEAQPLIDAVTARGVPVLMEHETPVCFMAMIGDTEAFQQSLYEEMLGRIKQDDVSVPYAKNGWLYYTRTETGKQYPIYCRKKTADAPERLRKAPIDEVIVTDSIPVPPEKQGAPITVLSVAPLLAQAIIRVHENRSVSELFR